MKKIIVITALALLMAWPAAAATDDFVADGDITVTGVTFGDTTADLIIFSGSKAESWQFSSGVFTVTNAYDSTVDGKFKIGSSNTAVLAISADKTSTYDYVCVDNDVPGTTYLTIPSLTGTYTLHPRSTSCTYGGSNNSGGGGGGGSPVVSQSPATSLGSGSTISASGGTIVAPLASGGSAEAQFGSGAISAATTVSIIPQAPAAVVVNTPPPAGKALVGSLVADFHAAQGVLTVSSFAVPVTITFKYLPEQLTASGVIADTLKIHWYDEVNHRWVALPGIVNTVTHVISAPVQHFTMFAVFGESTITPPPSSTAPLQTSSGCTTLASKAADKNMVARLKGRMLLQVESCGEVWYLDPVSSLRYYLADGNNAYTALRMFGLGITNENLAKIPVGDIATYNSKAKAVFTSLANKLNGRILPRTRKPQTPV